MAIEREELEKEKIYIEDTKCFIDKELRELTEEDKKLKERLFNIKKETKGKYSEELERFQKQYDITNKNLNSFIEAKKRPYFARVDFREKLREVEKIYIGKFGLSDSKTGDEYIVDWRAPIADLYYSGTFGKVVYTAPIGEIEGKLSLKRKFLIEDGEIKDAFDEGINELILRNKDNEETSLSDEFLRINLDQNVKNKLKDIVATIQKEQNEIIREDKNKAILVQGFAGSGKTTIALHRLAYLLYRYRNNLKGNEFLVIAPNILFLDYILDVLPDLGVEDAAQSTLNDMFMKILGLKGKVFSKDDKLHKYLEEKDEDILKASQIKASMKFKKLMDNYLKLIEKQDSDIDNIYVEDIILFEKQEIKRLYEKDLVHLPSNRRKDEIKRYLNKKLNERLNVICGKKSFVYDYKVKRLRLSMEDSEERRKQIIDIYEERDNLRGNLIKSGKKSFKAYFDNWKIKSIQDLYFDLYKDREMFDKISSEMFDEKDIDILFKDEKFYLQSNIIDADDLSAMVYLKFNIEGIDEKNKFKHILIDEAQDYSLFELYILKNMTILNSLTIVGDLAQGIYYYRGVNSWETLKQEVFENYAQIDNLTLSYRSTVEIIEFSNKVLKKQNLENGVPTPVLRHGDKPSVIKCENELAFIEKLKDIENEVSKQGRKNIAIICKTASQCKALKKILNKNKIKDYSIVEEKSKNIKSDKIIIPSYLTKGLEFDATIIYDLSDDNYKETSLDLKILYVILTRALHLEYIIYFDKISNLIYNNY